MHENFSFQFLNRNFCSWLVNYYLIQFNNKLVIFYQNKLFAMNTLALSSYVVVEVNIIFHTRKIEGFAKY